MLNMKKQMDGLYKEIIMGLGVDASFEFHYQTDRRLTSDGPTGVPVTPEAW